MSSPPLPHEAEALPLSGVTVLDFSALVPGPLATLILQEAGARVLRIVRPEGDPLAQMMPKVGGENTLHRLLNAGKTEIQLDLREEEARARVKTLLADADVLVEGFRPGVMARLGLGYTDLAGAFPRLIYCSISGYGHSGPRALAPGHDLNYQAESGLLSLSPGVPEAPVVPAALVADIGGGTYPAVINILLALIARARSGKGSHLDVAMADGAAAFMVQPVASLQATGEDPLPGAEKLTGGSPRYALYAARDGRFLAVGALEDKFWSELCRTLGLPDTVTKSDLAAHFATHDANHWVTLLAGLETCVSLVATVSEALRSPQVMARGLYARSVEAPDGSSLTALPLPLSPVFRHPEANRTGSNLPTPPIDTPEPPVGRARL